MKNTQTYLEIPPPIASPCLIKNSIFALFVRIYSLRGKSHMFTEGWVPQELLDTFHRVLFPQVQYLLMQLILLISLVTFNLKHLTSPSRATWKGIYTLVECPLVLEIGLGSITCLSASLALRPWFEIE